MSSVVKFAVIGIMWVNHHAIFSRVARLDRPAVLLNMLLLMTIGFLPYPTGVLGEALARGDVETVPGPALSHVDPTGRHGQSQPPSALLTAGLVGHLDTLTFV